MTSLQDSPAWQALKDHFESLSTLNLKNEFANHPKRADELSLDTPFLGLDYSKNLINKETISLLVNLADENELSKAIEAMFAGDEINNTEQRPALHIALRSPHSNTRYEKEVHATLAKMTDFIGKVTSGSWLGHDGQSITDVVNLGIGGSDLGPAMVYQALTPFHQPGIKSHFVSNVDPLHLEQTLQHLDPARTLFVIASKSFTTLETHQNSQAAKQWMLAANVRESDLAKHFVAVSANIKSASEFGISPDNIFPIWDWVGGRYSLWSAIGLPVALGIGMDNFRLLLDGAHQMDEHFRTVKFENNLPVIMALLAVWYLNIHGVESQVVLPYVQNLHLFPSFLQQLDMESLGKTVTAEGEDINGFTGGIVWGSAGTNGQHSFHQLLHQGTHIIPADFIAAANTTSDNKEAHHHLLANCFAQSQALMNGISLEQASRELIEQGLSEQETSQLAPHKVIPGNRPSNTLVLDSLTPQSLGCLIAAYEHKVYVQSVILGINAFDQYGVELGKVLSKDIYKAMNNKEEASKLDSSTQALISRCNK